MVAQRAGPILLLAGLVTLAFGLVAESLAENAFLNRSPGIGLPTAYDTYQHQFDASLVIQAIGVLLIGIAWSWVQIARLSRPGGPGGPGRIRTVVGACFALIGATIFAAWALVSALGTEYNLGGGRLDLPVWFTTGEGLFAGIGLCFWGMGWFAVRWSVA